MKMETQVKRDDRIAVDKTYKIKYCKGKFECSGSLHPFCLILFSTSEKEVDMAYMCTITPSAMHKLFKFDLQSWRLVHNKLNTAYLHFKFGFPQQTLIFW